MLASTKSKHFLSINSLIDEGTSQKYFKKDEYEKIAMSLKSQTVFADSQKQVAFTFS